MNHWQESYPERLSDLIVRAEKIAHQITEDLRSPAFPFLKDLYTFNEKGKLMRNTEYFAQLDYHPNTKNGSLNEFQGLYVFFKEEKSNFVPIYVGISRTVFRRLRQHGWGKSKTECTLANLMHKNGLHTKATSIESARQIIRDFKVMLFEEKEHYNLYFLEVALAGLLKTKWNSFRTH